MHSRLRAAILVLAVSAAPASAQEPSPLGLERPFLTGDFQSDAAVRIDLGGDGVTDLLVAVDGLLNGTEPIPAGDPWSLQSIVRGADGRWRHDQSFAVTPESDPYSTFARGDVDGDGSEDIVIGTIQYTNVGYGRWRYGIDWLRQDPPGELHRAGTATLDSTIQTRSGIHILGDGSGRVLIATPTQTGGESPTIRGTMLQWRAGAGWKERWSSIPDTPVSYGWDNYVGAILPGVGDPMLISQAINYSQPRRWGIAIPIRTDGWGPSIAFDLPPWGKLFELERGGERQVWLWTDAEPDSLYQIVKTAGGDSVYARAIAIEGSGDYPNMSPVDAIVAPDGDAYFLASDYDRALLVRLSPDGSARFLGLWTGPRRATGLMIAPDGAIEILWKDYYQYYILPPGPEKDPPPILPMSITRIEATADFDGDQRLDLVVEGRVGGVTAGWLLRGTDRSPWFRAPEPVSPRESGRLSYQGSFSGDLDGDGRTDLLEIFVDASSEPQRPSVVCQFWDGWRFRRDSAADAVIADAREWLMGDFDGNGRDELLVRTYQNYDFEQAKHLVLGWNRDRTAVPPVEVASPALAGVGLWHSGDVDGDGRDEMVGTRERGFSLWRINPKTGSAASASSWANNLGFSGGGLADLNGDGSQDFYWFGRYDSWVWSSGRSGPPLSNRTEIPLAPCASSFSAVDVDADGKVDFVGDGRYGFLETITDPLGSPRLSAWLLPELRGAISQISGAPVVWADVDRDGDPDLVTVCADGIRVHMNETLRPSAARDGQPMIRFTGRNPAHGGTRVAVHADCAEEITLELFDVTGRRVWKEQRNASAEGWVDVSIQPRVGGAVAPSGVYFLRVEMSGRVETKRIVLGF